ncbi:MAG: FtsX-like permease family protein [Bdellovibrionota bacterium]
MRFVQKVAVRYLRTRRAEAFISILTLISTIALAIGVSVLIVVMSIMNGFEYELKNKLLGANAHITVRPVTGMLSGWQEIRAAIAKVSGVQSVAPFTYHQALLQLDKRSSGVLIRGIQESDSSGAELQSKLVARQHGTKTTKLFGDYDEQAEGGEALPGLIIGRELAESYGVTVGDTVTVLSPQVQSSPFGLMPRFRRFQITGIYSSGLVEYESTLVYADLAVVQRFFRLGSAIQGFEIRLVDLDVAPEIAPVISQTLSSQYSGLYVQPWTETHKNLWEALRLERSAYFTVLLLLVVMASFSIVSTLVMLVLEKRKDIAVLRTLGATRKEVGAIFRISGMTIGLIGTTGGLILGYLLSIGLERFGVPLPEKIFPVATLPIRMNIEAFIITGISALVICYIATIYPVWRASHLKPSELLRYE